MKIDIKNHSTGTYIQKVIMYSKTGFKHFLKRYLVRIIQIIENISPLLIQRIRFNIETLNIYMSVCYYILHIMYYSFVLILCQN